MEEGRSLETRQCILEAAQRLFAVHGYHGASIRDIVHACGVSNAALYYHFGSKQQLYYEVLGEMVATVIDRLQTADPGEGTSRTRLIHVALAYAAIILESENVLQTLLRDMAQFDREEILRLIPDLGSRVPAPIAAILEDGIAAGELRKVDPLRVGMLILGMVNAMAVPRLYTEAETTLEQDAELVIEVLFEGIGI
ncbi:MAG: TetR/AcrR family transcriptional regulator [Anaerolineae bacterium]|jgi:AcrR family transcriptional regulator